MLFLKQADREVEDRGYNYTKKHLNQEKTQLKLYFMITLREMEKIFQSRYQYALALLTSSCILENLSKFVLGMIATYGKKNMFERFLQAILCIDPKDTEKVEDDLILMQLVIFWLIIDFSVNVIHFYVESHLIEERTEDAKDKVVKSLFLRFHFHITSYNSPVGEVSKTMYVQLLKSLQEITLMKESGEDLLYQKEENLKKFEKQKTGRRRGITDTIQIENIETDSDDDDKKHSKKSSSSSSVSESDSISSVKRNLRRTELYERKNFVTYEFSPMTKVNDKLLFIYFNRNKFLIGRFIRSLLFNIQRLSICLMLLSLCYSQSLLDYGLSLFCFYFIIKNQHFFTEANFSHVLYYSIYFVINWVFIRCDSSLIQAGDFIKDRISSSGIDPYDGYLLLLGITIYSLGFMILLFWTAYSIYKLLNLKADSNVIFSFETTDGYQVLDYKVWKKNTIASVNFIFKVVQTKLLEVYSLLVFVTCIYINKHLYFITSVLLIVFLIVMMDGLKSMKSLFKFIKFDTNLIGEQQFTSFLGFIRVLCWVAIVLESYDFFKSSKIIEEGLDLSPGVLIIYYLTLCFGDIMSSEEYTKFKGIIELEESIKADYIALNCSYQFNEEKLMRRVYAYIGKSKLDKMAADSILEVDFDKVELHMDYNKPYLTDILMQIYNEILGLIPSKIARIKHKIVNTIYCLLHTNTNLYRNMDLFVLYKTVLRKNRNLVNNADMDLKAYFCNDYSQFQSNLVTIDRYYESVKEGIPEATELISKKLSELNKSFEKSQASKLFKGKTYKELATYEWMKEEGMPEVEEHISKQPEDLEKAANLIYRRISKNVVDRLMGVEFEDLKPSLNKKGLITAYFGKRKIALFNLNENSFMKTHGFIEFKLSHFLEMVGGWISSNNIPIVFWFIAICSCITGSIFTILILAILLFAVLIEETYGNVFWWRILNILYLFKIMIRIFNQGNAGFAYLLVGDSIWTDIVLIVCINLVMFHQKKTGFESTHLMKVEDVGTAVVRILANEDLLNMVDGCIRTQQAICYELAQYLEKNLQTKVAKDTLKVIKSKCTYLIVKMFFEIDKFKTEAHKAAINLFKELKEDTTYVNGEKASSFLWRNFSIFSRKPGTEMSLYIFTSITAILAFAIVYLQYNETGRSSLVAFTSGTQAISAQTVLTIMAYVMLGVFEKWFQNIRSEDSITVRYHTILPKMAKQFSSLQKETPPDKSNAQRPLSKFEKLRAFIRQVIIALRLKPESREDRTHSPDPLIYKYFFSIILYILVCFLCFILQPVLATAHRKSLYIYDFKSFNCDINDKNCNTFSNLWISQVFFFLNIVYFYFVIQEMRKGKLMAVPLEIDYSNLSNQLQYYVYYKTPILRETCTLIDYSAQLTTLEFSDSLLCEDIKEYIIKAKMMHQSNSQKNTGLLIPRSQRVIVSWTVITLLVMMLILPLVIFSKFTTGDNEQEITEGSLKVILFAGEDRYLTTLYNSQFLLENRKLSKILLSLRRHRKKQFG